MFVPSLTNSGMRLNTYKMKSKITIEVDFENQGKPYIQVYSEKSDDVRDKAIEAFITQLSYTSNWAELVFKSTDKPGTCIFRVYPIPPTDLETQAKQMETIVKYNKKQTEPTK